MSVAFDREAGTAAEALRLARANATQSEAIRLLERARLDVIEAIGIERGSWRETTHEGDEENCGCIECVTWREARANR